MSLQVQPADPVLASLVKAKSVVHPLGFLAKSENCRITARFSLDKAWNLYKIFESPVNLSFNSFASLAENGTHWLVVAENTSMEYSLHKSLKKEYCETESREEVVLGDYRIDVVDPSGTLIEIQHSSLVAIRDKCRELLAAHDLLVVKPIVQTKQLVKLDEKNGNVLSKRLSPKRGNWLTAFEELVYFTQVFPHKNLSMEFVLVKIRETRFPGHGRRRRRRANDHEVQDIELVEIVDRSRLQNATDLFQWLPFENIPKKFDTEDLAKACEIDRSDAQRITYCLRETGAIRSIGKKGRSNYYQRPVRKLKRKSNPKPRKEIA